MNMESLVAEIPINGLVHIGRLTLQVVGQYIHLYRIPNCHILLDEVKIAERADKEMSQHQSLKAKYTLQTKSKLESQ